MDRPCSLGAFAVPQLHPIPHTHAHGAPEEPTVLVIRDMQIHIANSYYTCVTSLAHARPQSYTRMQISMECTPLIVPAGHIGA